MSFFSNRDSWVFYALLSAVFAALTSIFAKLGIKNVDSNLATAIRTIIILIMAWVIVFITGSKADVKNIDAKSWIFLIASGVATGLSWLFYFKAIQLGDVSKVAPIDKFSVVISMALAFIVLGETIDLQRIIGALLITAGTFVLIF